MVIPQSPQQCQFHGDHGDLVVDNGGSDTPPQSPIRKVSSWSGPPRNYHRRQRSCLPTYVVPQDEPEEEEGSSSFSLRLLPRRLAKLSVLVLAFYLVCTNLNTPKGTGHHTHTRQRALGSAAIKSVTDTLSPILPFTGGIDLRKEDYWSSSSSPWETLQYLSSQVWQAFNNDQNASTSAGLTNDNKSQTLLSDVVRPKIDHALTISATQCFLSPQEIGQLTLEDVSQLIRYAMESNRARFDEAKFLSKQLPRVRKAIQTLKSTVQASRGNGVQLSTVAVYEAKPRASSRSSAGSTTAASPGSMDALLFAAAMRVFGEWRIVRQVPEGYKGYAVGMSLGHKDIVQNVAKVEAAVHLWLDTAADPNNLRSPTLAQLMEHEAETGVHPNLPRLKDRTGSMGLLWVRRQLQYQTQTFANVMQGRQRFPTTTDAVSAAYDTVYNQYHGWAVQKIFSYSFQAAPDSSAIFRHMNPHKFKELREGKLPASLRSSTQTEPKNRDGSELQAKKKEENPVVMWFKKLEKDLDDNPIVSWFKKVGDDSKRLVDDVRDKLFPHLRPQNQHPTPTNDEGEAAEESEATAIENYITQEMTKDAHENISVYLETTKPLLDDLARVFAKYNMDDPTKV